MPDFDLTAAGETLRYIFGMSWLWVLYLIGLILPMVLAALLIITILILNLIVTIPSKILQRKLGASGH